MESRKVVENILNSIIPSEVSDLYIQLIKLIVIYKINYDKLSFYKLKQFQLFSEFNGTYKRTDLENNKSDSVKKEINLGTKELGKWYYNEIEMSKISVQIKQIIESIGKKMKEISDFDDNRIQIDSLSFDANQKLIIYNNMIVDSSKLSFLENWFDFHLRMWKSSFVKCKDIAEKIVQAYKKRELIDAGLMTVHIIYSSLSFCNSKYCYSDVLSVLFSSSDEQMVRCNFENLVLVKAVSEFLENGHLSEELIAMINNIDKCDISYKGLLYLMKNAFVDNERINKSKEKVHKID